MGISATSYCYKTTKILLNVRPRYKLNYTCLAQPQSTTKKIQILQIYPNREIASSLDLLKYFLKSLNKLQSNKWKLVNQGIRCYLLEKSIFSIMNSCRYSLIMISSIPKSDFDIPNALVVPFIDL